MALQPPSMKLRLSRHCMLSLHPPAAPRTRWPLLGIAVKKGACLPGHLPSPTPAAPIRAWRDDAGQPPTPRHARKKRHKHGMRPREAGHPRAGGLGRLRIWGGCLVARPKSGLVPAYSRGKPVGNTAGSQGHIPPITEVFSTEHPRRLCRFSPMRQARQRVLVKRASESSFELNRRASC